MSSEISYQQKEKKYFLKKLWRIVGNFVSLPQIFEEIGKNDEIYGQH